MDNNEKYGRSAFNEWLPIMKERNRLEKERVRKQYEHEESLNKEPNPPMDHIVKRLKRDAELAALGLWAEKYAIPALKVARDRDPTGLEGGDAAYEALAAMPEEKK